MRDYYDEDKLIIPNGELILNANCKYCLPCGICELRSSFDKKELCNQFKSIGIKKTCINCLNKGIAMKDFPCKECIDGSKWRPLYNE